MKNKSYLLIYAALICVAIFSCTKDNTSSSNDLPDHIGEILGMPVESSNKEDASILIKSNESLNSPSGSVFLTSGAHFKDGSNKKIDAGDLSIFGVQIPFLASEQRYLNRDLSIDLMSKGGYTPGDSASVTLTERAPNGHYAAFNVTTSTPTAFNAVVTLQPDARRIDKNKALNINFNYDPSYNETYFILAQNDKPVLIESTTGSFFFITKSRLSFLDVGKPVNYYIARGDKDCLRNNTSTVCIKKLLVATGGGLKVIDSSQ